MSKLVIVVPADRRRCGRALLLGSDGATRFGPIRVLATASEWAARRHGNAARDPHKAFGHPPAGSYAVAGSLPPGVVPRPKRRRRFGALGALVLTPVGGDALEALRAGRRRFLVHGGPRDQRRRLRPTFGGFRVSNRELGALLGAVNDANAALDPVSSVEVVETAGQPPWSRAGRRDRAGRFRPAYSSASSPTRCPARPRVRLGHAALIALGFGIAGTGGKIGGRPGRRGFVGLAVLALGALGASACSAAPDAPSPDPSPADPCVPPAGHGQGEPPDAGAGDDDDGGGEGGGYAGDAGGGCGAGCGDGQGAGSGPTSPGVGTGDGIGGGGGDDTGDDSGGGAG